MNKKPQKLLSLGLLISAAILLSACTPQIPKLSNLIPKKLPYTRKEIPTTPNTDQTTESNKESPFGNYNPKETKNNLTKLLQRSQNLVCSVSQPGSEVETESTLYTNGADAYIVSRIPEDIASTEGEATYILYKGDTVYSWSNRRKDQGVKYELDTQESQEEVSASAGNNLTASLETAKYECSTWESPDNNIFVVPLDVTFQDMSEMYFPEEDRQRPTKESSCENCRKMPGESEKEACLKAYECE